MIVHRISQLPLAAAWRIAVAVAVSAGSVSSDTVVKAKENRFAAVTAKMQRFVDEHQASGIVTLVGQNDKIVHLSAVGAANLQSQRRMTPDTLFRIMSMTKPITATGVMVLQDEGKLSIDDPVAKYIPAFGRAKLKDGKLVHGLTIRHLLTHTSGLVGDQKCVTSLEATAEMLAARPFGFQPGTKWEYGPSLNVCGRIIEVVSGKPYEDFLAERIFLPLGMKDTTFVLSSEQRNRIAAAYQPGDDQNPLVPSRVLVIDAARETVPNPSGGLLSSAGDMFRFYQMILNGGELDGRRIVSADAVRAMTSVATGELVTGFTRGNGWGLGWCIIRRPQGVTDMLSPGTFGHGGLYGTQGWVDPGRQAIFVLMIQRTEFGDSDNADVRREFQRLAVQGLEKSPNLPTETRAAGS